MNMFKTEHKPSIAEGQEKSEHVQEQNEAAARGLADPFLHSVQAGGV
jgi:hypothetical protein